MHKIKCKFLLSVIVIKRFMIMFETVIQMVVITCLFYNIFF